MGISQRGRNAQRAYQQRVEKRLATYRDFDRFRISTGQMAQSFRRAGAQLDTWKEAYTFMPHVTPRQRAMERTRLNIRVDDMTLRSSPDPKAIEREVRFKFGEAIVKDLQITSYHDPRDASTMYSTDFYVSASGTTNAITSIATTAWDNGTSWDNSSTYTYPSYTYPSQTYPSYPSNKISVREPEWVDDAKPRRLPPPIEFNKYINVSDIMEEFIEYLGSLGLSRDQVLDEVTMDLFIKWLLITSAEAEQVEPPPDVVLALPAPKPTVQRCLGCGQFMKMEEVLPMHDQRCSDFYYTRERALA